MAGKLKSGGARDLDAIATGLRAHRMAWLSRYAGDIEQAAAELRRLADG